jgi:histidinol-phosphate aminotransferase
MLDHLDLVSKRAGEIAQERDQLYTKMKEIEGVSVVPSSANFLLFKVKGQSSKSIYKNLVAQGYSVRDVSDGDQLRACLRVSVGSPEHNKGFIGALRDLSSKILKNKICCK